MIRYYIVYAQSNQSAHTVLTSTAWHMWLCVHMRGAAGVGSSCQELPPLLLGRQALVLIMSQKVGTAAVCTELNV